MPTLTRPSLADRGLVSLLALLCAALVVGSTGASLWLRTTADDLAGQTFAEATYAATQVKVTYTEVGSREVPAEGASVVADALPPAVRAAVQPDPRASVVSPEMLPGVLPARPSVPSFLTVVGMPDLEALVDVVAGRLPDPGVTQVAVEDLPAKARKPYLAKIGFVAGQSRVAPDASVVEVVLEESAATEMNIRIDDLVALSARSFGAAPTSLLRVVGTYVAADPFPSPLDDTDTARLPAIDPTPDAKSVRASAVAADPTTVLVGSWAGAPDLRYTFDPASSRTTAATEPLVAQAREVELQSWPPLARALDVTAVTGLGDLAAGIVAERDTSDGMTLLGLASLAAGGFAVLLAAAVVLTGRRRATTRVMRARGAGTPWLLGQRAGEALLLTLPGLAVAGAVVALVPGGRWTDLAVGGVTAALCIALVSVAQLSRSEREPSVLQLVARDAVQLVLVVLAAAAVWLVWRRGSIDVADPVTVLTAPLVGAAASVAALRLLQLVLRLLRRGAARSRGLTSIVGLSQGLAISQQVVVATAAVVLALSAAAVSVALGDSLRGAAHQTGWEQVGSDLVVHGSGLEDETAETLAGLAGVEATSPVYTAQSVSLDTALGLEGVRLVAFDPDAMRAVGEGSPLQVDLTAGSGEGLPVIVSPDLELSEPETELRYATSTIPVEVVGRMERIPGVTAGESFVAIDAAALSEASDRNLTSYDAILVSGSPDADEVRAVARDRSAQATVEVRSEIVDDELGSPVVTRTTAVLLAVAIGAGAVAAFAVVLLVTLGGPVRRRTGTLLVTLGADVRQARRVAALGVAPLVAVACLTALACGGLLILVADRGLDLAGLTATEAAIRVLPSSLSVALAAVLCVGLVVLAGLVAMRRPHEPAERTGTERR